MSPKLLAFKELSKLFEYNGFKLYLVGGTVRDYLLKKTLKDMDVCTDATPEQIELFLPDANFRFALFGSVKATFKGVSFDITTLRSEDDYLDFRHPGKIKFVKTLEDDYLRRDFTINAMYLDKDLHIIDFVGGQKDLQNHILKMVGEPNQRIKEDPLRILRAIRFAALYDLTFDKDLEDAINSNAPLLAKLNPQKISMEMKKIKKSYLNKVNRLFDKFSIKH